MSQIVHVEKRRGQGDAMGQQIITIAMKKGPLQWIGFEDHDEDTRDKYFDLIHTHLDAFSLHVEDGGGFGHDD